MARIGRVVAWLFVLVSVTALSCGGSVTAPIDASHDGSLRRIVDDIGGINLNPGCVDPTFPPCPPIEGTVQIITNSGTFSTSYLQIVFPSIARQNSDDPRDFRLKLPHMDGSGRLEDSVVLRFEFIVRPTVASVAVVFTSPREDFFYEASSQGVPTFDSIADSHCFSGQRLETTVTVLLEHLGKAEIRDSHCAW
jgi:hypothetical protein